MNLGAPASTGGTVEESVYLATCRKSTSMCFCIGRPEICPTQVGDCRRLRQYELLRVSGPLVLDQYYFLFGTRRAPVGLFARWPAGFH